MNTFDKVIRKVASWLNNMASIALVICMLLVTLDVILRDVFKSPITGTYEMTGFLTAVLIGCGLAYCALNNGHISINIFIERLSIRMQKIIDFFTDLLSIALMGTYTVSIVHYALQLMKSKEVSVTLQFPFYTIVFLIGFCFLIFTLALISMFLHEMRGEFSS